MWLYQQQKVSYFFKHCMAYNSETIKEITIKHRELLHGPGDRRSKLETFPMGFKSAFLCVTFPQIFWESLREHNCGHSTTWPKVWLTSSQSFTLPWWWCVQQQSFTVCVCVCVGGGNPSTVVVMSGPCLQKAVWQVFLPKSPLNLVLVWAAVQHLNHHVWISAKMPTMFSGAKRL